MNMFGGTDDLDPPRSPHPLERSARTPVSWTASKIFSVKAAGLSTTIDPNPMYIGRGPAWRNAAKSGDGVYDDLNGRK